MNMIKLDTVEWTLYESPPISYEEFISTYGKLNTQQVNSAKKSLKFVNLLKNQLLSQI